MKTKDRILKEALELFNQQGSDDVSLRAIARSMDISVGNLAYHYANTDRIIEALYLELAEKMDQPISEIEGLNPELSLMVKLSRKNFEIMYQYRFILLYFTRIARRIPSIRDHFVQLIEQRKLQFRFILSQLETSGIITPEPFPDAYTKMVQRSLVIGDYWIPHAHIHFEGTTKELINHYHQLMISEIEPYLSDKGRAKLTELLDARSIEA